MFIALVTVAVVAIRMKPTIERYFHLRALRSDPKLLEQWLMDERLPAQQTAALERFCDEPAGKQAVFELYLAEYDRRQFDSMTIAKQLATLREQGGGGGHMHLGQGNYTFARSKGRRIGAIHSMMNVPQNVDRRAAALRSVHHCVGTAFRSADIPGFEFEIVPVNNREAAPPSWAKTNLRPTKIQVFKDVGHVCHFRSVE